jgi:hypothetical protein
VGCRPVRPLTSTATDARKPLLMMLVLIYALVLLGILGQLHPTRVHFCFAPDSGPIAASQRTDAMGPGAEFALGISVATTHSLPPAGAEAKPNIVAGQVPTTRAMPQALRSRSENHARRAEGCHSEFGDTNLRVSETP